MSYELVVIGTVHSSIKDWKNAPKMEDEPGAVQARIEIDPAYVDGLDEMRIGQQLELFTWFHKADRDVLSVHPRGDINRPRRGVFSTRSPFRPNPIGLHRVKLIAFDGPTTLIVDSLEAIDGTPVIDIKPNPKEIS